MPASSIDHSFTATKALGRSSDPTYAGALSFMRRKYTKDMKGADAVVWGIPFDAAVTNRPGARFGPQAIRRASAIFDNDPQYPFSRDLFEALAVVDYGDGVRVVVDEFSAQYLKGAQIDFEDALMGGGFQVRNPNAVKSCACGQSFDSAGGGGAPKPCS